MPKKYIRIISIVLLLLCLGCIFFFSQENDVKSYDKSINTAKGIVTVVSGNRVSEEKASNFAIDHLALVRKTAHFLEFFVLGILSINVISRYKKIDCVWCIIALLFCIFYALTDEAHQLLIQGRTARMFDVLVDTVGSFLGILVFYIWYKKRKKNIV